MLQQSIDKGVGWDKEVVLRARTQVSQLRSAAFNAANVFSFIPDDQFGTARATGPRTFELSLTDSELSAILEGELERTEDGERRASSEAYDLVILDMRLPGKSGLEVLHALRAKGFERPVLVLTAQDAVDAKVQTLRAGADDYVTKPFAFEELLARIEALSRRPRQLTSPRLEIAGLVVDLDTREVTRSGVRIELTPKEFKVLEYLMRHPGRVMSRTLITEYAWGYHFDPGTNIVDVVITHLRKKVDATHEQKLIGTVRGVGYVIKE